MKLLINADDLGVDWDRDIGIFVGVLLGVVTSVSVIVTQLHSHKRLTRFVKAIRFVRPKVSIGLHLNLTEFELLSCSLCDLLGTNCIDVSEHPKVVYWENATKGTFRIDIIIKEIMAQINSFYSLFGNLPSHLDGHNHCHVANPLIFNSISELVQELEIPMNRIPNEKFSNIILHKIITQNKIDEFAVVSSDLDLSGLARTMRVNPISDIYLYKFSSDALQIQDFRPFIGTLYGHVRRFRFLKKCILSSAQKGDIVELMVHPGLNLVIPHQTKFSETGRFRELLHLIILGIYLRICRRSITLCNQNGVDI